MKKLLMVSTIGLLSVACLSFAAHPGKGMQRLDADGDGQISREEFQLPEQRRGPNPFARADTDGDGVITREELLASIESASQERSDAMRDRLVAMFDEADEDGNGVVTRQEMEDQAFARLDADGDGFITEEEARAMMERRREHRSQRQEANG